MPNYHIGLRSEEIDFESFSPEEYQKLINAFEAWNDDLKRQGKLIGSSNLKDANAVTLRQKGDDIILDGPYCESKEALTGFFLITADDEKEAIELAKGCPLLPLGGSVEVREAPHVELEK